MHASLHESGNRLRQLDGASCVQVLLLVLLLALGGCAMLPPPVAVPATVSAEHCLTLAASLDAAIESAGVRDHQSATLEDFPFLRVSRFLAGVRPPSGDEAVFAQWLGLLQGLDMEARQAEIANLPRQSKTMPDGELLDHYHRCSNYMRDEILASPKLRDELSSNATTPDAYHTSWRVLGLYPLTSIVVAHRIGRYQDDIYRTFELPLSELPLHGRLLRYGPPAMNPVVSAEIQRNMLTSHENPLGIPLPDDETLAALFQTHAPVVEIDTVDDNDRIGAPYWADDEIPHVDTAQAVLYRHVSHTRFYGKNLLQLNYIMWFPARPLTGMFDIYGGHLDGINWRVTLDEHGQPLMYDSMHHCGCYHQFYPTHRLRPKPGMLEASGEPPLVPQTISMPDHDERLVIRVAHRTHFIERIYAESHPLREIVYAFADYNALRSLPYGADQRRGMFGDKGIVPGSQRSERWILWPMGIPSPGAMRQWGQHAIAFVGRRHFDDMDLIETYFEPNSDWTK